MTQTTTANVRLNVHPRPLCVQPDYVKQMLAGDSHDSALVAHRTGIRLLDNITEITYHRTSRAPPGPVVWAIPSEPTLNGYRIVSRRSTCLRDDRLPGRRGGVAID